MFSLSQHWLIHYWTTPAAITWLLLNGQNPDKLHGLLSQTKTSKLCTMDHQNLVEEWVSITLQQYASNFPTSEFHDFSLMFVSQGWSRQGCIFTTFDTVIGKKESIELFYKVRNCWDWRSVALDCPFIKLLEKSAKWGSCITKACYFTKFCMLNHTFTGYY